MQRNLGQDQRGFVSLLAILMIIAVIVAVGATWSTTSISELQHGFYENQAQVASARAESCLEDAFLRLKLDNAYAGGSMSMTSGTCAVVVSGSGGEREIHVTASEDQFAEQVGARVGISGRNLTLLEWLTYDGY